MQNYLKNIVWFIFKNPHQKILKKRFYDAILKNTNDINELQWI